MTTIFRKKKKCALCGHERECYEVASTNSFGPMDLDTRPPEMQRSTINHWVQMCEKCGYSNTYVDELIPGIGPDDLKTEEYEAILNDSGINKLPKAFLLAGHLYSKINDFKIARTMYLHAAWAFDDLKKSNLAKQARNKAIESIGKCLTDSDNVNIAVVSVDLNRRSGRFEEAEEIANRLIGNGAEDFLKKVLEFQIELCRNKDDKRHTVGEVEE
jgi:hypothetical protein